jgi:uncharacterized membrane protein
VDVYALVKTAHILSATVLFGTGLGIAFFFWIGGRSGSDEAAYFAARATVIADLFFTTTAVIVQPVTGAWLVMSAGFEPFDRWLALTYALYALAAACWIPVVFLQLRIRDQLKQKLSGGSFDAIAHARLRRWWFALGWPAFLALIVVFHLMVAKPS